MEKKSKLIKYCNICENDANYLCYECMNYFCESCYKLIHDKKKTEHKKDKADPYVPIDIRCLEHPNGIMDFFCVDENGKNISILNNFFYYLELCCSYCCYKNLHKNHKIIEIFDDESLKKENITLETSTKNFERLLEKINLLKDKIEKEITKINNSFEKINEKLTKSFQIKHEKLIKEENDLREKLQNEVTKVKEKLENYLSEASNKITLTERIKKGIEKLKQDEKKNIYKILSYISTINKNNKAMSKLSYQNMENINIIFNDEKNIIKYEPYIFNGFYIKNIEFSNISYFNLKISWDIESLNNNKNDLNQDFEFILEIKQKNSDNKFKQIYKGKYFNYLAENLSSNTIYIFQISLYIKITKVLGLNLKK